MTNETPVPVVRPPGTVLGSYRVVALLGEGGMGQVYRAEHIKLKRHVALKLLLPELAKDEEIAKRFFAEARSVNAIASEHIVEIFDFVEEGDDKFFVMELIEGRALAEEMGRQELPLARSLDIAHQLAVTLEAVHSSGIIHRDLKPENIILTTRGGRGDFVKLLDFGIAKVVETAGFEESELANKTSDGAVMGTPAYVSPEQLKGEELDYRADIYAFGLLLFQMLTGERPFRSRSLPELVMKQISEEAPSISGLLEAREFPRALDSLVRRCLEKDRALRPPNMGVVAADLNDIMENLDDDNDADEAFFSGGEAPEDEGTVEPRHPELLAVPAWQQPPALAGAGVVGVALLALAIFAGATHDDDPPPRPSRPEPVDVADVPASPRASLIARIDEGEAEEVLALMDGVQPEERSPGDDLLRAHALAKLGREDEALEVYADVAASGVLDERAMNLALAGLQVREAEVPMKVLTEWKGDAVKAPLYALLDDPGWWPRHHALKVLTDRGEDGEADREKIAITDLLTGPNCGTRRYGLSQVAEHGKSDDALAAIKKAAKQKKENRCIKKKQVHVALRAVKERAAAK